jgi:hypothetical protein
MKVSAGAKLPPSLARGDREGVLAAEVACALAGAAPPPPPLLTGRRNRRGRGENVA